MAQRAPRDVSRGGIASGYREVRYSPSPLGNIMLLGVPWGNSVYISLPRFNLSISLIACCRETRTLNALLGLVRGRLGHSELA